MRDSFALLLAGIVSVVGFVYYLIFGAKELTPSVHSNLSKERLAKLLGESFSYGQDGAEFMVCASEDACVTLTKEIRGLNDVRLMYRGIPKSIAPLQHEHAPPDFVDFGEDIDAAVRFVMRYLSHHYGRRLEEGCYYQATGVSIYRRHGWSA